MAGDAAHPPPAAAWTPPANWPQRRQLGTTGIGGGGLCRPEEHELTENATRAMMTRVASPRKSNT
jgi:hypothetical protein